MKRVKSESKKNSNINPNSTQNYFCTVGNFKQNEEISLSSKEDSSFFMVEEKLSKYNILHPLGRGSSSFVYKATDIKSEEQRVIKLFYFFNLFLFQNLNLILIIKIIIRLLK